MSCRSSFSFTGTSNLGSWSAASAPTHATDQDPRTNCYDDRAFRNAAPLGEPTPVTSSYPDRVWIVRPLSKFIDRSVYTDPLLASTPLAYSARTALTGDPGAVTSW